MSFCPTVAASAKGSPVISLRSTLSIDGDATCAAASVLSSWGSLLSRLARLLLSSHRGSVVSSASRTGAFIDGSVDTSASVPADASVGPEMVA